MLTKIEIITRSTKLDDLLKALNKIIKFRGTGDDFET